MFAVCFAESYLFEWMRNDILPALRREGLNLKKSGDIERSIEFKRRGEFQRLTGYYFPVDKRRGLLERWITVPARAFAEFERTDLPSFFKDPVGGHLEKLRKRPEWSDFAILIDYRNGVMHGHTSRPLTNPQPEKEQPNPSANVLDELPPGWAVSVVFQVVRRLHEAWGSPMPEWLMEP